MLRAILKRINDLLETKSEFLVFVVTTVVGAGYAWYVYSLKLTTIFVDQNSHLNIARQILDSVTPGISQIGFWPPLLHMLMAPITLVTPLFESGLAGAFVLIPAFGLGSVFLYKILHNFTHSQLVSFTGVLFFITNPYILYYAVTPMTELLFISSVLGVAYYLMRWVESQSFASLIYLGIFITFASLARFEGFILIPVAGAIILFRLISQKKKYHEIEAVGILFILVAGVGVAFTFIYGWVFAGDPLIFMNGAWSASAQQQFFFLPAAGDIGMAMLYILEASTYMLGGLLIPFSALSFIALIFLLGGDNRLVLFLSVSFVLISPLLFDIVALYQGSAVLYVSSLPPFGEFFNERYGLYWIGFAVFTPLLLAGVLLERIRPGFWFVRTTLGGILLTTMVVGNISFLYQTTHVEKFSVLTTSSRGSLSPDQKELAEVLRKEYDYGKILITRALQNFVTVEAGIPLKNYILESNYQYYDSALDKPWLYVRWVVMYNPDIAVEGWRKENELVSVLWSDSEIFNYTYELVFENDSERLYLLREDVLRESLALYGIDEVFVPSLNGKMVRWDTAELSEYLENKSKRLFTLVEGGEPAPASVRVKNVAITVQ